MADEKINIISYPVLKHITKVASWDYFDARVSKLYAFVETGV